MKFSVECEMQDRWVPQFLAMLEYMERLGQVGSSRSLTFYADGDGDFHPKFEIVFERKELDSLAQGLVQAEPKESRDMGLVFTEGDRFFDAG